jgi:hypothetical protein
MSSSAPIVLDHERAISLDQSDPPFNNYQAFRSNYLGLKILADTVRDLERKYAASDPHAAKVVFHMSSRVPDIVPCAFNWFAVTLVNYLRLVALVELMAAKGWKSAALTDPAHRAEIRAHCTSFVRDAIPEVYVWRNKVSAHFAATDPFHDDNLGTLEQSIMNPVTYQYPHYYVGSVQWNTAGQSSQLPSWALTKTYEELRARFWPEFNLAPIS